PKFVVGSSPRCLSCGVARVGSVIDQVAQATLRTALLQPLVKTAVHLHHLPKVLLALAPSPVPPPLPLATPQPLRQHPASQRCGIHLQAHPAMPKCSAASVGPKRSPTGPPS